MGVEPDDLLRAGLRRPDVESRMLVAVRDIVPMKERWTLVVPAGQDPINADIHDLPILQSS